MTDDPQSTIFTEDHPNSRAKPTFRNVITTGNLLSIIGTAGAMLPIISLIYAVGTWTSTIEARFGSLTSALSSVADLEKENQRQLDEFRNVFYNRRSTVEQELNDMRSVLRMTPLPPQNYNPAKPDNRR